MNARSKLHDLTGFLLIALLLGASLTLSLLEALGIPAALGPVVLVCGLTALMCAVASYNRYSLAAALLAALGIGVVLLFMGLRPWEDVAALGRALVALGGLGANTVDVAIYCKTDADKSGAQLVGENAYTLRFDTLPPTLGKGFWSVTAYGSDDFLIDNPIDRYCINDRSDFIMNADGGLEIQLSASRPQNPRNWLPVSREAFHLYMRIYSPDRKAMETWTPPVILPR